MQSWLDRLTMSVAPRWAVKRLRARLAGTLLQRHFEAAVVARRTIGWRRTSTDANASVAGALHTLRDIARDMTRNNGWAKSGLRTLVNQTVSWGIMPDTEGLPRPLRERWEAWANTTACDAEGRNTLPGLQKLVARAIVRDGEVLIRRRWRSMRDVQQGLPLPMQLQVLEPDFLDTLKDNLTTPSGRIIQGVEFDSIGRRVAYWLLPEHPGATFVGGVGGGLASKRIAAEDVLHVFPSERSGQVRGPSLFAASTLRLKDFDEYEDAALMKQKIAACLAVITSDVDGTSSALGTAAPGQNLDDPEMDLIEPGMIKHITPGRSVSVVNPPSVSEHGPYSETILRGIAAGMGISYEDLTGDFSEVNFSSARMARLRAWDTIEDLRWITLVPQFCDPVWRWFVQAAAILEDVPGNVAVAQWTAPPAPFIDPEKEGLAYQRNIRNGVTTWPEMVRERGYNPTQQLREIADWNRKFDEAGVVLDSDPRKTSQQGQARDAKKAAAEPAADAATATNGNGNGRGGHA